MWFVKKSKYPPSVCLCGVEGQNCSDRRKKKYSLFVVYIIQFSIDSILQIKNVNKLIVRVAVYVSVYVRAMCAECTQCALYRANRVHQIRTRICYLVIVDIVARESCEFAKRIFLLSAPPLLVGWANMGNQVNRHGNGK